MLGRFMAVSALGAALASVACASGVDDPLGDEVGTGGAWSAGGADDGSSERFALGSYAGAAPNWASGGDCEDECPVDHGIQIGCKKRFMYGVNYAWSRYGSDFGGVAAWSAPGVSRTPQIYFDELTEMREAGANTIRWWVFPDFRGEGVRFDEDEMPLGLGATTAEDLDAALQVAEAADVYLMFCMFSFDAFRYSGDPELNYAESLGPIVRDSAKRAGLLDDVVRPIAKLVEEHPLSYRVVAWDVMNEPEWAVRGPDAYGGDGFDGKSDEFDTVTHGEMETFLAEAIQVLHEESSAPVSVGFAAAKWATAWHALDTDFHQFHMYDWIDRYWPYDSTPAELGLDDKPLVMGEFPLNGLVRASYQEMLETWWANGYAGALGWSYSDADFRFDDAADDVRAFAESRSCETDYSQ